MNSRWSTNPIKRDGQIVSIRPNVAGDIEILKTLGRYTLLTADDIAALTQRSYGAVIARINLLKRKPNQLLRVCDTQLEQPRLYQWCPQALQLTPAGVSKLLELGFEPKQRPSKHFIHSITENQTAASLEIGARLHNLEHVCLDQTPVPVTFTWRGKTYNNHHLTPDGGPIGLGYGNDIYRFVVFETDCATEPLTSSNRDRQAIEMKFAAYLTVIANGLYETTWDIPNLTVLFTTTTKSRIENMIELLVSMTDKYLNCFGFQTFGTILMGQPDDRAWAVTRPWLRVKQPLNLKET